MMKKLVLLCSMSLGLWATGIIANPTMTANTPTNHTNVTSGSTTVNQPTWETPSTSPSTANSTPTTEANSKPVGFHQNWCDRHPEKCESIRQERTQKREKWCKKHPKKCEKLKEYRDSKLLNNSAKAQPTATHTTTTVTESPEVVSPSLPDSTEPQIELKD